MTCIHVNIIHHKTPLQWVAKSMASNVPCLPIPVEHSHETEEHSSMAAVTVSPAPSLTDICVQDVMAVGHSGGVSTMLVPGAGEPNFDSYVADPYQQAKARQEQEVHLLLDKLQPDMIVLDPTIIGQVSFPCADKGLRTKPLQSIPVHYISEKLLGNIVLCWHQVMGFTVCRCQCVHL